MLEKLQEIESSYHDIEQKLSDPEVISNQKRYMELLRKHSEIKECVTLFRAFKKITHDITETEELLADPEMGVIAQDELKQLTEDKVKIETELREFLIPPDPDDYRNALIEIRSGTGGEEAALFASSLYRMYTRYADSRGWKTEVLSHNETELGGIKEISFSVAGAGVFSRLKFESGTHRVQRVPETEASGRVHTSAATVAILPEAEDVDITIDVKELRIDTYRSSGAGGQHVNKTDSAVRITHLPTGVVVACQDERSQFQNKDKAMRMLRAKLYEKQVEERAKTEAHNRKLQVGTGDRSQKIRTYNYPQGRVTDHRINVTVYKLDEFMNGDLDDIISPLMAADRLEKMQLMADA